MSKSHLSSSSDEDEGQFDNTMRIPVANTPVAALETIIQAINKRFEVYHKRRTATTPFSTPVSSSLAAVNATTPPVPRSILGDSTVVVPSIFSLSAATTPGNTSHPTVPPHTSPAESIIAAHHRPVPYWEERELYIAAEDLCCYLNGGINYRLLCEQYQRALEVLLTLVREDVKLCASGELEVVPGGTSNVLRKLEGLLKKSKQLLEAAGVDVPPKLPVILEQLTSEEAASVTPTTAVAPTSTTTANNNSSNNNEHPNPAISLSPAAMPSVRRKQNSASPGPLPASRYLVPPSNNNNSSSPRSPRSLQQQQQTQLTAAPGRRPISNTVSTNNAVSPAISSRRNTPGSAVIVDPPVGGGNGESDSVMASERRTSDQEANGSLLGTHESHGSILRYSSGGLGGFASSGGVGGGTTGPSLTSFSVTSPLSLNRYGGYGAVNGAEAPRHTKSGIPPIPTPHPPSEVPPRYAADNTPATARSPEKQQQGKQPQPPPQGSLTTPLVQNHNNRDNSNNTEHVSPLPTAPPSLARHHFVDHFNHHSIASNGHHVDREASVASTETLEGSTTASLPPSRGRLRLLEELYGAHYAMDGMTLLADVLGVVFTREYDQGPREEYKNGFMAFQRDVNNKVMPALKSYETLQLRIGELTPLRSAYLASCLVRHTRPNSTVLEELKKLGDDRAPETLELRGLHLGDLGTAALVESVVPRLYRLHTLDLSDNRIQDSALEHILSATRFHPALESLDLSRNPITDAGLPYLLRIVQTVPKLTHLIVEDSLLTPAGKRGLETELVRPGTHAVPSPSKRRRMPSPARGGSASPSTAARYDSGETFTRGAGGAASASAEPLRPPLLHALPSTSDSRLRWSPKAPLRAESVPSKLSAAPRKPLFSRAIVTGASGTGTPSKLPALRTNPSTPSNKK